MSLIITAGTAQLSLGSVYPTRAWPLYTWKKKTINELEQTNTLIPSSTYKQKLL